MSSRKHSAQERQEILLQQKASGLSIPEFCRQVGVSDNTLYRWNKEATWAVGLAIDSKKVEQEKANSDKIDQQQ